MQEKLEKIHTCNLKLSQMAKYAFELLMILGIFRIVYEINMLKKTRGLSCRS